jgi:hypothetical protein
MEKPSVRGFGKKNIWDFLVSMVVFGFLNI